MIEKGEHRRYTKGRRNITSSMLDNASPEHRRQPEEEYFTLVNISSIFIILIIDSIGVQNVFDSYRT